MSYEKVSRCWCEDNECKGQENLPYDEFCAREAESKNAETPVTTHDDGKFVRTALVVGGENTGSIDIVNTSGERIALLNLFTNSDNTWFAVDVIDKDERFDRHAALTFKDGLQQRLDDANGLIAADFRKGDA